METSFFKPLAELGIPGNWVISVQVPQEGTLTASILFKPKDCGDQAHRLVQPAILKGEPGELDAGFFSAIKEPVTSAAALFVNMESHLKSIEHAKTSSKMAGGQKNKEKPAQAAPGSSTATSTAPPKEEKRKAWEDIMAQVDELKGRMKYQEAIDLLPKPEEYPDKKSELEKLEKQLRQWLSQFNLFASEA